MLSDWVLRDFFKMADDEDVSITLISDLDFADPLCLHASDISSVPLFFFKLKGTENYRVWSCAMKLALQTKNKIGFIDCKCVKSIVDEVLSNQWERCNSVVLSWILGCVSEELYLGQVFSDNAKVVWDALKETYDKINGSVIFNVHQKINSLTQSGSTICEYYHKLILYGNSMMHWFSCLIVSVMLLRVLKSIPKL